MTEVGRCRREREADPIEDICRDFLLDFVKKIPPIATGGFFKIEDLRLVVTDQCPYSCVYCGVHYQKALDLGLITRDEFEKRDIGGNEGASIGRYLTNKSLYLSLDDYRFLVAVLAYYFGVRDVTFSGGDPFARPDIRELIDSIDDFGLRTTALTKGLPLFSGTDKNLIARKSGRLSRIIFSLDTLNAEEHASVNLPLMPRKEAVKALPKTLAAIRNACDLGYNVDINSVIIPIDFNSKRETADSFGNIREIIEFALKNKVNRIKFIELDLKSTLGSPYIEKYFKVMADMGYFKDFHLSKWADPVLDLNNQMTEFALIKREKGFADLQLCTYRTHCPTTFLRKMEGDKGKIDKKCDFREGGELNINSIGQIITCQKNPDRQIIDLRSAVVRRDILGIIELVKDAGNKIGEQQCAMEQLQNNYNINICEEKVS
ncbi:MAG: radical SAM protein [Patescibacteria group bacterium]